MSEMYDDYKDWDDGGQDSPLALVGIMVMALTGVAIIANALFFQPKSAELAMIAEAQKLEAQRRLADHTQAIPTPRVNQRGQMEVAGYGMTQENANQQQIAQNRAFANDRTSTILAVQSYLTRAGYYVGPLTGQENGETKEAVRAFQDAMGLPATGLITAGLHDVLAGKISVAAHAASLAEQGQAARQEQAAQTVTLAVLPKRKPRAIASTKRVPIQTLRTANTRDSNAPVPPASIPNDPDPVLAKVQNALTKWGFAQLTVDGRMGDKTANAISKFQRSRGHPVTGRVNDRLLKDMIMMGYLDLG